MGTTMSAHRLKLTHFFIIACLMACGVSQASEDKPVQHLKLESISDAATAKSVFLQETAALKAKNKLDAQALQDIHIITYSLEKSVAFYTQSSNLSTQAEAKVLADVVEALHLNSENNRTVATQKNLTQYFSLADKFKPHL
jgi:hypothetical protein